MNTDSDDAKVLAELRDLCDEGREKMIENLADVDENLADKVLAEEGEGYASISSEMAAAGAGFKIVRTPLLRAMVSA